VTTTSEFLLVACLVRQQLLQHVVTVRQYAAEEFVVAVDGHVSVVLLCYHLYGE